MLRGPIVSHLLRMQHPSPCSRDQYREVGWASVINEGELLSEDPRSPKDRGQGSSLFDRWRTVRTQSASLKRRWYHWPSAMWRPRSQIASGNLCTLFHEWLRR